MKPFLKKILRSRSSIREQPRGRENQEDLPEYQHRPPKGHHGLYPLNGLEELHGKAAFDVDIVAIHGLNGDIQNTWTHKRGTFWLQDLLPVSMPGARVFSYGYPSDIVLSRSVARIGDFAIHLLNELKSIARAEGPSRPIIYVCHSLGGIVFKEAMNIAYDQFPEVWLRSKGVVFLGTPHRGSSAATIGKRFGDIINVAWLASGAHLFRGGIRTALLGDLRQNSPQLISIANTFTQRAGALLITTFYETEITSPVGTVVVDHSSAVVGVSHEKSSPLLADHRDICRFESENSVNYKQVLASLQQMAAGIQKEMDYFISSILTGQSLDASEKTCVKLLNTVDVSGYQSRLNQRIDGTLQWVLQDSRYTNWASGQEAKLLWVTGYSGCGKTILSSYIFHCLSESPAIICRFFCDGKVEQQQNPTALLRSLIYQIVVRRRKLLRLVRKASDLQGFQLFNRFDALWDLFLDITRHEKKGCINIVIDAIDECSDETQLLLVNRITKLLESGVATPIKIFMTSRPNTTAIYALQESSVEYIRLSLEENQDLIGQDVHLVIQQRLELLARRGSCSPEFCRRLEESLVNKAEGTFLWVSLVLPLLEKRRVLTVSDLLMIQQLPQGLIALYKGFLKDIPIPDRELAGNILRIVVSSARPLNVDEIAILLAGGQASLAKINYPFYNSESIQLMLRPLVRISNSRVELVHQSIKEFLIDLGRDSTSSLAATFGVSFRRESPMLARACMRYLTSDQFAADLFAKDQLTDEECPASPVAAMSAEQSLDDGLNPFGFDLQGDNIFDEEADVESERLISLAERYKLYDYAATHWATHFAQSNDDVGSDLYELTISLCDPSSARFHNWFRYFWVTSGMHESYPTVIDPLVITSFFGHSSTLQQLLKKSHNDGLEYGQALYWATRRGRFSCMEMLISQKRDSIMHNPRCSYVKNQSPLAAASQHGHLQCVQYLLKENMFDFNEQSSRGRTPISLAAGSGHAQILAALLSIEEIDPNLPDGGGSTPLFWAVAANSAQATSRLLDDSRVEPNHLDGNGRNALSWAAADGQYILVGLLLRNPRIDANNRDSKGWTPLIYATQNGHIDVVKLLVQNIRVDPSCKDESGRNAISWASEKRDKKDFILHYLLQHDKGGADAEDKDGWTPLAWAMNPPGYLENVLILLQSGLVDVNHPDHDGRSPLSFAVSYGYLGITQTLVRARAVELNVRDISGRTPLFYAAGYGNLEIAQLLVETKGVDIDPRDNSGRTPLSLAAGAGSLEIVRLLMRTPGVNKNAHDNKGNTPLWYARHSGSDDVVLELSRS